MRRVVVLSLQLLAAIAFAALCIALAFSKVDPGKVWAAWFTLIIFGYVCHASRRFWKRKLYWIILVGCVLVHLVLLLTVQKAYPRLSLFYYISFGSIETIAVYWLFLTVFE